MNRIDPNQSSDNRQLSKKQVEILDKKMIAADTPIPIEDVRTKPVLFKASS